MLGACSSEIYSDDPVGAYRRTKAYLNENQTYDGQVTLASLSVGMIDLGKKLFHDPRLSRDGNFSCASCHDRRQGYTENGRALPRGADPLRGRNAPTLYDVVSRKSFFHDGRAQSLEEQAVGPLLEAREMANPSMEVLAGRVRGMPDYNRFFAYAFDGPATPDRIASALSAYQRTLITGPNTFELWKYHGKAKAMTEQAVAGYRLFDGKARCSTCHLIGGTSAPMTDEKFHDTGYAKTKPSGATDFDTGRFVVTGAPGDRFAFRTPSLRNVAVTAPYMHDGRLGTLEEVVGFFNMSGNLDLKDDEQADLVAFLEALTSRKRP